MAFYKAKKDKTYKIGGEDHELLVQYFAEADDVMLEELGLKTRTYNALRRYGYRTVNDVLALSHELYDIHAFGKLSIEDLEQKIAKYIEDNNIDLKSSLSYRTEQARKDIVDYISRFVEDGAGTVELLSVMKDTHKPDAVIAALDSLAEEGCIHRDAENSRYYPAIPSFIEVLDSMPDDLYKVQLKERLSGVSLPDIAKEYGITTERARQRIQKMFYKTIRAAIKTYHHSTFKEDRHALFYKRYGGDKKFWMNYMGVPIEEYMYLRTREGAKALDLIGADEDTDLTEHERACVDNYYADNGKLFIEGEWVKPTKLGAMESLLPILAKDKVAYEEFSEKYNKYMEEHDLAKPRLMSEEGDTVSETNFLSRLNTVLWTSGRNLRYYDIPNSDWKKFAEELRLPLYRDVVISTELLFRENPKLMKKFDIRDKYELHNYLKKLFNLGYLDAYIQPGTVFRRQPHISFGGRSIHDQIAEYVDQSEELENVSRYIEGFSELYGFDPATIEGVYSPEFSQLIKAK